MTKKTLVNLNLTTSIDTLTYNVPMISIYSVNGSKPIHTQKAVNIYRGSYKYRKGTIVSWNKKGQVKVDLGGKVVNIHYAKLGYA